MHVLLTELRRRADEGDHDGVLRLATAVQHELQVRARRREGGAPLLAGAHAEAAATVTLSELALPERGSPAGSVLLHAVHTFGCEAAGASGRWADAEQHAERAFDALQELRQLPVHLIV